jgi:hypothetical protein
MISKLPDALADALGRVVADLQREWRRDADRNAAESRAVIAELRADVVALKAEMKDRADQEASRVAAAIAGIRNGEPGANGKDADPALIENAVAVAVAKAVDALELPAGSPGPAGDKGDPGASGRDGAGVAGAIIDRDGILTLTMSDGATRALGVVVGKDGEPGADGKDGRDGFGFEDMTEELADDGRTIIRRYSRGDEVKEFRHALPVMIYRGIYKAGQAYAVGDTVTFGGSLWIAEDDTDEKPDGGKGWRLAAKRGRDGKDGIVKHQAPPKPVKGG